MKNLKTENCILCGKKAVIWQGHVVAKEKMALGNYVDKKVIAGFCEDHKGKCSSDDNGCYGNYNSDIMGRCVPLFPSRKDM